LDAWRLKFSNDSECAEFYGRIQLAVATSDIRQRPYAVRFRQEFDLGFESDYGWDVYNVDRMMDRMAISTSEWRISDINSGYQVIRAQFNTLFLFGKYSCLNHCLSG
jgi:hypothetical protein